MFSQKQWILFDLVLLLLILAMSLNVAGVKFPSFGQAILIFDREPPRCVVQWQGEQNTVTDLARCCRDVQTLGCSQNKESKELPWKCGTSNTLQYYLNDKAHYSCQALWRT